MSEIEIYDPSSGKCDRCMGSGHFIKVVGRNSNEYTVLTFHCPICHGTGVKSDIEKALEKDAMMDSLREKGLIE